MLICLYRWLLQARHPAVTVVAAAQPSQVPRSAFAQPPPGSALTRYGIPVTQISKSEELKRRFLVTVLVVAFYYYPNLVTDALSFFACYDVDRLGSLGLVPYPENSRVRLEPCTWLLQAMHFTFGLMAVHSADVDTGIVQPQ